MGKRDRRHSLKMNQRKAQAKKKIREKRPKAARLAEAEVKTKKPRAATKSAPPAEAAS